AVRGAVEGRGLAGDGGGEDPGAEEISPPVLEAIVSPDEIETTPPIEVPKKRLKARKLAPPAGEEAPAAVPRTTAAAVLDAAAALSTGAAGEARNASIREEEDQEEDKEEEKEEEGQRGGLGEPWQEEEKGGGGGGEDEEEKRRGQRPDEERGEQEEEEESATLVDTTGAETETEDPAVTAGVDAAANVDPRQHHQHQHGGGHCRDSPVPEPTSERALSPAPSAGSQVGAADAGSRTGAADAERPSGPESIAAAMAIPAARTAADSDPGVGCDLNRCSAPPATAPSSSTLRGDVAQPGASPPPPPPVSLESAALLFIFWHQARVQFVLARLRHERAYASWLAARIRWSDARVQKGKALVAELRRAKRTGAPVKPIIDEMTALRNQAFPPRPMRGGRNHSSSGGAITPSTSPRACACSASPVPVGSVRLLPTRRDNPEPLKDDGASLAVRDGRAEPPASLIRRHPPPGEDTGGEGPLQPGAKRRRPPSGAAVDSTAQDVGVGSRYGGGGDGGGGGSVIAADDGVTAAAAAPPATAQAPATARGCAETSAGPGQAGGEAHASTTSGSYSSPTRSKAQATRCHGASSGQRLRRASTLPSPPRALATAIDAEGASIGAGAAAAPAGARASCLPSYSTGDVRVAGGVVDTVARGRAGAVSPSHQRPTSDQLNDPVFRGRMKARARAAKAAQKSAAQKSSRSAEGPEGKSDPLKLTKEAGLRQRKPGGSGGGGGGGERQAGEGGWMSSRRRDWCLDDVCFPATERSGGGGGAAAARTTSSSSSSPRRRQRRLSRSKSAPPSPQPPQALPAVPSVHTRDERRGAGLATVEAAASGVPSSRVGKGAAEARAAADDESRASRGAKRAAALRPGDSSGGGGGGGDGVDDRAGGDDRPRRQGGVGPRSHAKRKTRGGEGVDGEGAAAADLPESGRRSAAAEPTAADDVTLASPSCPSKLHRKTSASVRFRETAETSPAVEQCTAKGGSCRKRRTPRSSKTGKAPAPAKAAAMPALPRPPPPQQQQQQQHRSRCPRGQEMLRQANAVQAERGTVSPRTADRARCPEGLTEGVGTSSSPIFSGLSFVLVGLPTETRRDVEGVIVAGAGRVLEDMTPQPRERCGWHPPAGAVSAPSRRCH
ncbi:unnamed protein product, partial [Scytosiphon promiscuus]